MRIDSDLLRYLFDILKKHGGNEPRLADGQAGTRYLLVLVDMPSEQLSDTECRQLFTPLTSHIDFLLCRQIVRELGEATNAHGCGIEALPADSGQGIQIRITLTQQIWNHLKLSS